MDRCGDIKPDDHFCCSQLVVVKRNRRQLTSSTGGAAVGTIDGLMRPKPKPRGLVAVSDSAGPGMKHV